MKIVYILAVICLVSCKKSPSYEHVSFDEQGIVLAIPTGMKVEKEMTLGSKAELIRTYYLPDSTCFIRLEVYQSSNKSIEELAEKQRYALPYNDVTAVLLSTSIAKTAAIEHASINYKSDNSGSKVNNITIYNGKKYTVIITFQFGKSYSGSIGDNRETIRRVIQSLKMQ